VILSESGNERYESENEVNESEGWENGLSGNESENASGSLNENDDEKSDVVIYYDHENVFYDPI
jgi:hypothetical protein